MSDTGPQRSTIPAAEDQAWPDGRHNPALGVEQFEGAVDPGAIAERGEVDPARCRSEGLALRLGLASEGGASGESVGDSRKAA